jgi:hypothetical protein
MGIVPCLMMPALVFPEMIVLGQAIFFLARWVFSPPRSFEREMLQLSSSERLYRTLRAWSVSLPCSRQWCRLAQSLFSYSR